MSQFKGNSMPKLAGPKCYEKHPVLSLGGGQILGASCLNPAKGFDVYVGLDWNMRFLNKPVYPWSPAEPSSIVEVHFTVPDGGVPGDPVEFLNLLAWLQLRLQEGKRVHVGCIGGHGRTGLLLAALVQRVEGNAKAAQWVRTHHCKEAIETSAQSKFLHTHCGVEPVEPSHAHWSGSVHSAMKSVSLSPSTFDWISGKSVWGAEVKRRGV